MLIDGEMACPAIGPIPALSLTRHPNTFICGLISRDERGLCACDVERAIGLSQAAVSHQMAILIRAGLVEAEKRGRWMYYRRNESALARLAVSLRKAV